MNRLLSYLIPIHVIISRDDLLYRDLAATFEMRLVVYGCVPLANVSPAECQLRRYQSSIFDNTMPLPS